MRRAAGARLVRACFTSTLIAAVGCFDPPPPPPATPTPVTEATTADETTRRQLETLGYASSFAASDHAPGAEVIDAAAVTPGIDLWTSQHAEVAYLSDTDGRVLHTWTAALAQVLPEALVGRRPTDLMRHFARVDVTPDGDLIVVWHTLGVARLGRDSRVKWALAGGYHHHAQLQPDGTVWVISNSWGGTGAFGAWTRSWMDRVEHLGVDGQVLARIDLMAAIQASPQALRAVFADPPESGDIFHANSVRVVPNGALPGTERGTFLLVSLRNPSAVVLIDADASRVVAVYRGPWRRQHDATPLGDGRILLYDNVGLPDGTSRVLEWDVATSSIAWSWPGDDGPKLVSALLGAVQRLPTGHTLVTHAMRGDVYEVTPAGQVVWRFTNPYAVPSSQPEHRGELETSVVLSMTRHPRGWFGDWLSVATPPTP